ncbi:MAG TPA: hypothetical protein VK669_08510 [Candidatus Limnocylindrales bacterium]|nr:hypothetical protein [Candidatus Limnocylindrales bacterium]
MLAVAALSAMTASLVPNGASAAEILWKMTGLVQNVSMPEPGLRDFPAYDMVPYRYKFQCQVRPGATPLKTYPDLNGAVAHGETTSKLMTTFQYVYVPMPPNPADHNNFIYVCRGQFLVNGSDVAVHDGSDISSDTLAHEVHSITFKIDKQKLIQAVGSGEACFTYDPSNLKVVPNSSSPTEWQLDDDHHIIGLFASASDARLAQDVAGKYKVQCFIGLRLNADRHHITEYFK